MNLSLHRSEDEPFVQKWEVARQCVFSVRASAQSTSTILTIPKQAC